MFSVLFRDMVYRPIVCVLYLSVAHGHSHELVSFMILAFGVFWESGSGQSKFVEVFLSFFLDNIVGADLLWNSSEIGVLVHGFLSDWDDGVDHIP